MLINWQKQEVTQQVCHTAPYASMLEVRTVAFKKETRVSGVVFTIALALLSIRIQTFSVLLKQQEKLVSDFCLRRKMIGTLMETDHLDFHQELHGKRNQMRLWMRQKHLQ